MNDKFYERIYREYELYYGSDRFKVLRWEPFGKYGIIVYQEGGYKSYYDSLTNTVYNVRQRTDDSDFISDDVYAKRFAWKFRTAVYASGLSREDICDLAGISNGSLSNYMNGKKMPTIVNICKLAKILKCPVQDLIDVDNWDR